jgi:hypothetical protein
MYHAFYPPEFYFYAIVLQKNARSVKMRDCQAEKLAWVE